MQSRKLLPFSPEHPGGELTSLHIQLRLFESSLMLLADEIKIAPDYCCYARRIDITLNIFSKLNGT